MKTRRLTLTALFLAMTLVLSYVEHLLPALPFMPPGVKLGLSHIIIMYCLFVIGSPSALLLAVLKSLFVFLTRGLIAGLLSALGGLLSLLVMTVLVRLHKTLSYTFLSVVGAVSHNIGQLIGASLLISHTVLLYYLPVLLISGLVMGLITGTLLRVVMPALRRIHGGLS